MIRAINKIEQEGENVPVRVSVVDGNLTVGNLYTNSAVDAFGRQRISEPYTLADYTHIYSEESEMLTKTSGANSNTAFNSAQAKMVLTASTGANDFVVHQSRMYHNYMPGKSQLTFQSFKFGTANSGTNKRIGLFDNNNGIFFQQSGDGTLGLVLRTDVSGSVQDTIITQSNWNKDKCNGTGPSLFNLDITKTQLFTADFQWLGVGRVRAGFVHDGNVIVAHEFYNSNNKDTVYWSNPNLPVRCEVRNYNGTATSGSMDQICATVMSEGGYREAGIDFSAQTTGFRNIAAQATMPVIGIRLKTGFLGKQNRGIVKLNSTDFYSASQLCNYEIWRLPSGSSLVGGSWTSAGDESIVEYNISATSYNTSGNSNKLYAGFIPAGGAGVGNTTIGASTVTDVSSAKRAYIAQNIDSTDSNIFVIVFKNFASPPGNTTDVLAGIQWREIK